MDDVVEEEWALIEAHHQIDSVGLAIVHLMMEGCPMCEWAGLLVMPPKARVVNLHFVEELEVELLLQGEAFHPLKEVAVVLECPLSCPLVWMFID